MKEFITQRLKSKASRLNIEGLSFLLKWSVKPNKRKFRETVFEMTGKILRGVCQLRDGEYFEDGLARIATGSREGLGILGDLAKLGKLENNDYMRDVAVQGMFGFLINHGREMIDEGSIEVFIDMVDRLKQEEVIGGLEVSFLLQAARFEHGETFDPVVDYAINNRVE